MESYYGSVSIFSTATLEEVADAIIQTFNVFSLQYDDSGRFEEYPAFSYETEEIEILLIGDVDDAIENFPYEFRIKILDVNAAELGRKFNSEFLTRLPAMQAAEKNGYINISEYTNDYIRKYTQLECCAAWVE
ncbi:hypothetical protein [Massilia aquatica]|uniref:Uncharacterized protein n=1 Tax=Massilia aquatica TaxID=2609000 RepID=A0ABX0MJB2_9BURK|nr:hypothetical protein [Massilia aquatica]NHZ45052.1 hypothetical protein [Massilia aquatica]